jgi:ATP-dependent DNA ligase
MGLRNAIRTAAPVGHVGLLNLVALVVPCCETWRGAHRAVDVDDSAALTADEMVMIVADAILEASRRPGRLDPAEEPFSDQHVERVVHGLRGDGSDFCADRRCYRVSRHVGLHRNGFQHRKPLRRYLNAVLSEEFDWIARHGLHAISNDGMNPILDSGRGSAHLRTPALRTSHLSPCMAASTLVMSFPIEPPVEPMLAKISEQLPSGGDYLFEPKWDGFRALVFRSGSELFIQSRDLRPLDRYFPEVHDALIEQVPDGSVLDGEIVIVTPHGLDFDLLQMRLHPAASRVAKLAKETPASFVAFDVLAAGGRDVRDEPQDDRRRRLEALLAGHTAPLYLTPMTRDVEKAAQWLKEFEGAGLDGVIAKPRSGTYQPGKRAMLKIKHARTADCAVAGFRWHKAGPGVLVGSLLLGLYDDKGRLHHVGVTSSFTAATRKTLAEDLEELRKNALSSHPWKEWADVGREMTRMPGGQSRWSAGKNLSWEPLRVERVCEVKYDHMQGDRFRHAAIFLRWRPDRRPEDCRYDQLQVTTPYELDRVFGAARPQD